MTVRCAWSTFLIWLISATNANLRAEIAAGRFREDLYFRLNVIELEVPALSRRPDDIRPLAEHFLARHAGGRSLVLSAEALESLERHDWSGNVRELDNRLQRAALVCEGGSIRSGKSIEHEGVAVLVGDVIEKGAELSAAQAGGGIGDDLDDFA